MPPYGLNSGISILHVIEKPRLHRRPQLAQAVRPGLPLARLDDQDVRHLLVVAVGVVALQVAEEGELALPPPAPADRLEAAGRERLGQRLAVPEELVAPPPEGAGGRQRRP